MNTPRAALSIFLLAAPWTASAKDLRLKPDGTGDFATVQAAINAAEPGDRILLAEGTYPEHVTIQDKSDLSLIGEGSVTLATDDGGADVIKLVKVQRVLLKNLHGVHTSPGCDNPVVSIAGSEDVTVEGCDLNGSGTGGVVANGSRGLKILGNHIHKCTWIGVSFTDVSDSVVRGNLIEGNSGGVEMSSVAGIELAANTIARNTGPGLKLEAVKSISVGGNVVAFNSPSWGGPAGGMGQDAKTSASYGPNCVYGNTLQDKPSNFSGLPEADALAQITGDPVLDVDFAVGADAPCAGLGHKFTDYAVAPPKKIAPVAPPPVAIKLPAAAAPAPAAPAPRRDSSELEEFKKALAEINKKLDRPKEAPAAAPAKPAYSSDVDKPSYEAAENADNVAVVIGVEKYPNLPAADFADRDAQAVRAHLRAMGYPSRNIMLLSDRDATRAGMSKTLNTWLPPRVNERSTVFFYYSGHGAPDPESSQAYLVPIDGDPEALEDTAYPVKQLYEKLEKLKAKRVIVALDACFSGAGGRSVLAKGTRPLVSKIDVDLAAGKVVALGASRGDQTSGTIEEQGHGAFTYYMLKGLNGAAAKDGAVTVSGLYDYLAPKVEDAARLRNRSQTPQLMPLSAREGDAVRLR